MASKRTDADVRSAVALPASRSTPLHFSFPPSKTIANCGNFFQRLKLKRWTDGRTRTMMMKTASERASQGREALGAIAHSLGNYRNKRGLQLTRAYPPLPLPTSLSLFPLPN